MRTFENLFDELLPPITMPTAKIPTHLIDSEILLNILAVLQSSLELPSILQNFFDHIQPIVDCHSIHFVHTIENIDLKIGEIKQHVLVIDKLTFSREKIFSALETQQLKGLVSLLEYPLRNALKYRKICALALQDPLTKIANRMAFDTALQREIAIAARHQHALSLLVLDLDSFKQFNDHFGHAVGDEFLKNATQIFKTCIRKTDVTFRIGGDEFIILLNKTSVDGALKSAKRICKKIESLSADQIVTVTISIGVAAFVPHDTPQTLFERADKALYTAKANGKNGVFLALN